MSDRGLGPAAAACVFPGFRGTTVPDWLRRELEGGLGGVVLFAFNVDDPEQLAELTSSLRAERGDLVVSVDEEGGDVTRLEAERGSSFPGNLALGAVDDPALTRRVAAAIGGELAAVGVNMNLAPVADVVVDPAAAIVGVRSFGSDPQLVARHVAAYVEGLQEAGVAACAKHYPGHGEVTGDSHLELPTAEVDRETLFDRALPPFAAAVDAGTRAVMTAHIRFPAVDELPATISPALIGLLRTELGFDGVVMTDALEMRAIFDTVGLEEGAVQAVAAGADALCLGAERSPEEVARVREALVTAVEDGRLAEERLHEAAQRVTELAAWASSPRPSHDLEAGAEAANRALRVEGDVSLPAGPLVVELWPKATIAAGPAHHGLGELLDADTVRVRAGEPFPQLDDPGRTVVVVRDAHRHPWQRELVPPGVVVVETGVPAWRPPEARGYVVTHGAGRANLAAAAGLLAPR
jgi:beta-N-acetylhexosaminidase